MQWEFTMNWEAEDYIGFQRDNCKFILQNFNDKHFAENLMVRITVSNLDEFWDEVMRKGVAKKFNIKLKEPTEYPHGSNDFVTMHTKQAAYLTYVMAFGVPRGVVTKALYWDTENPYHYARLQTLPVETSAGEQLGDPQTEELLIVGGEDHKTGQADDAEARYARLTEWARARFPVNGAARCQWSGQVLETIDGLAFIGRNPLDGPNVYIATGDSGQGMTHGTIAGILLTDLIVGRQNPWVSLYDPARKSLRAAERFLTENANVAWQYAAWVTGGDVASVNEIAPGQGAVVRRGLTKAF